MSLQRVTDLLTGLRIPHHNVIVHTTTRKRFAIGTELYEENPALVSLTSLVRTLCA